MGGRAGVSGERMTLNRSWQPSALPLTPSASKMLNPDEMSAVLEPWTLMLGWTTVASTETLVDEIAPPPTLTTVLL